MDYWKHYWERPAYEASSILQLTNADLLELKKRYPAQGLDLGYWARFPNLMEGADVTTAEDGNRQLTRRGKASLLAEYSDAYFRATYDLAQIVAQKQVLSDSEALPILYLFCHFVELSLKAITEFIILYFELIGESTSGLAEKYGHDIDELLENTKLILNGRVSFLSKETEDFIRKISKMNEYNQAFRYPFTKLGSNATLLVHSSGFPPGIFFEEFKIHGSELTDYVTMLQEGQIPWEEEYREAARA